MNYTFGVDNWGGHFSVPCSVVTQYLRISDGDHIKVLLYILAAPVRTLSSEVIADAVGCSVDTVDDAVAHWTSLGVLSVNGKTASAAPVVQTAVQQTALPVSTVESIKPTDKAIDRKIVVSYTQKELLEKANQDSELKHLFDEIQKYLKFSINGKELGRLVELYELYHYDVPTILLMAEYCRSMDKTSVNYLATTLENWYSQDITTYDQVEAEIVKRTELYSYEKIVCKCFGISGRLSSSQREYAEKWRSGGIDESLLGIAYDKCMDGTGGKLRFKYIDTVISSWMNKGIKTAEQVKADDEQFRGKNSASSAASEKTNSYSIEKLEEMDKNFVLRNEGNKQ